MFLACRIYPKTASVGGSIPLVGRYPADTPLALSVKTYKILCSPHRHKLDGAAQVSMDETLDLLLGDRDAGFGSWVPYAGRW